MRAEGSWREILANFAAGDGDIQKEKNIASLVAQLVQQRETSFTM
jgi:hypothetical protein